jgi:hypothetical protein
MWTHPSTRKRYGSQPVVVAAMGRIVNCLFGCASPSQDFQEQADVAQGAIYRYHQGDLFLPGPTAMVLDPSWETPLFPVWGAGWLNSFPNAFSPLSGAGHVVASNPAIVTRGTGGLSAGQLVLQALTVQGAQGPIQGGE